MLHAHGVWRAWGGRSEGRCSQWAELKVMHLLSTWCYIRWSKVEIYTDSQMGACVLICHSGIKNRKMLEKDFWEQEIWTFPSEYKRYFILYLVPKVERYSCPRCMCSIGQALRRRPAEIRWTGGLRP